MARTTLYLRSQLSLKFLFASLNSFPSTRSVTGLVSSQFLPVSCYFSGTPVLQRKQHDGKDDVFDMEPDAPPKLFVVQPRVRPESHLRTKLEEALNLANSLEQQRDGVYATEFVDKEMPPHLVVQNPAARSPRAGESSDLICCLLFRCFFSLLDSYLRISLLIL